MLWTVITICALIFIFLFICYACYRITFHVDKKQTMDPMKIMTGEQYSPFADKTIAMINSVVSIPYEDVYTTSFDGFKLHARLYFVSPDAPVEILVHGYKSNPIRDFSGGLKVSLDCGHNVILVTQRAHGLSEGRCLTFGIKERYDVLSWISFANKRFKNNKILLVGMSMGSATVLMASSLDLPSNVVGILADCGYTSPREIIRKVVTDLKLPVSLSYFFIKTGGQIFGRFNSDNGSAEEELKHAKVPVLLIHGMDDRFVPYEMSIRNYKACTSPKALLTVEGAAHGMSFVIDNDKYIEARNKFIDEIKLNE